MNLLNTLRRGQRAAFCLAAVLLVAACGGGVTSDEFRPTRVLSFGDEASVLDDSASPGNARKYTVNSLKTDPVAIDCNAGRIWVQALAAAYGHLYPQCNPNNVSNLPSRNYAAAGARVAEVTAQITAHLAGGTGFQGDDLVTVFVGTHDILDAYAGLATRSRSELVTEVEARGAALGEQIKRISQAGGKVLVATVPDVGRTPFGVAEEAAHPNEGRANLLALLTDRFNARLRTTLPDDGGRTIGLVVYDQLIDSLLAENSSAFSNRVDAACDATLAPVLTDCTTATLVAEDAETKYMWADAIWPGLGVQSRLGTLAINQSRRNPF